MKAEGREGSQRGQQIKDCHLDQRVLAVPALQDPLAHLRPRKDTGLAKEGERGLGKREAGFLLLT